MQYSQNTYQDNLQTVACPPSHQCVFMCFWIKVCLYGKRINTVDAKKYHTAMMDKIEITPFCKIMVGKQVSSI